MSSAGPKRERWVRCPACGKQTLYSADNPARPFCSPRCRSVDLGAWASESYRVAAPNPAAPEDTEAPPSHNPH
jgi:endogenous inhibitor of DNA gyrase (YacG/DUF329 family)